MTKNHSTPRLRLPSIQVFYRLSKQGCPFLSLLLGLVASAPIAIAGQAISPFQCAQGICGFNVLSPELRIAPCSNDSILVVYSHDSGATLIQCSSPENENLSYIFDRFVADGPRFELRGARFVKSDFLAEAADSGVPDRFGSVPLCAPADAKSTQPGEIFVVQKAPRKNGDGYCDRLVRIADGPSGISVQSKSSTEPRASNALVAKWAQLTRRILEQIPDFQRAQVSALKAPLFRRPDKTSVTKMYLIRGDNVEVLDTRRASSGWIKVGYLTKSGRHLKLWIHASDLSLDGIQTDLKH